MSMALALQVFHAGVFDDSPVTRMRLAGLDDPVTVETALGSQRGCWLGVDRFGTGVESACFRTLQDHELDLGLCAVHILELRDGVEDVAA